MRHVKQLVMRRRLATFGHRSRSGSQVNLAGKQYGFGLIEMMISTALSLLAIIVMITLVASTLGASTSTIKMSHLSQELRASMQLMSRDLRRANYHSGFLNCFANVDCRADLNIAAYVNTIHINDAGNCFWYWLDRDSDADLGNDAVGGFRRGTVNGVGVMQMRITGNSAANCDDGTDWEPITDPDSVDITGFSISSADSYTESLSAHGATQVVEKLRLSIVGRMISDPTVQREIQDLVLVRNDIQSAGS